MRLIKIGLANVNTTVGAFDANLDRAVTAALAMAKDGCTVGCFQEQVIAGYPAEDLVQWRRFVDAQWSRLERFCASTAALETVFCVSLTVDVDGHLYNAVAVTCRGRVLGVVPKEKLPTYGVFYENRTFSHGRPGMVGETHGVPFGDLVFRFPFGVLAVETCEDLWTPDGPMRRRCFAGAELVVNASASPWRAGVTGTRREIVATRAADNLATLVYVNQVGGNDSLVFDGGGYVCQAGRLLLDVPRWREGVSTQVVDLDRVRRLRHENTTWRTDAEEWHRTHEPPRTVACEEGPAANAGGLRYPVPGGSGFFMPEDAAPTESPRRAYFRDLVEAMVMGLDYYGKTFRRGPLGVALSGGKDSVLSAVVAWLYLRRRADALPEGERTAAVRDGLVCLSMPTRYNSDTTRGISRRLCEELGVTFREVAIEEAFTREVEATKALTGQDEVKPITLQNIQARLRAERMWNWANETGGFWIQTGNMSEKAVGYTTVGGDLMGAYSLIGNLPKTVVIELLRFLAEEYGLAAVRDVLATKASAELADGQEDEKDLMPFPVLDACMALYAGEKLDPEELKAVLVEAFPEVPREQLVAWADRFVALFHRSIFKWVQAPESVHLGGLELDRERALQLPVVHSREWEG